MAGEAALLYHTSTSQVPIITSSHSHAPTDPAGRTERAINDYINNRGCTRALLNVPHRPHPRVRNEEHA
eukprot:scaffold224891_cov36-Tisochrysis_lutea.AAC.1